MIIDCATFISERKVVYISIKCARPLVCDEGFANIGNISLSSIFGSREGGDTSRDPIIGRGLPAKPKYKINNVCRWIPARYL